jgi:hypothetical protein
MVRLSASNGRCARLSNPISSLVIFNVVLRPAWRAPDWDHLTEHRRRDMPVEAVAILQPAAHVGRAAVRQRGQQPIDLSLVVALDHERIRVIEGVERPSAGRDGSWPMRKTNIHQ